MEVEVIIEIAESENFIPGQLRDLILMPDGTMLVSDWGSHSIEQFSKEGKHMREIMAGCDGGGDGGGGCTGIRSCFTNWSLCYNGADPDCKNKWVCETLSCTCELKLVTIHSTATKKCNY